MTEGASVFHRDVPVVDLHRHMDGNVRLQTMIDLARQHALDLPAWDVEGLRPHAQVTEPVADLKDGYSKFELTQHVIADYDACRRIAWENLEDAVHEGIDYVELRFSPLFMAEAHQLDPSGVASVVCEAVQEGCGRLPVRAKLIVILSRHYGPEACQAELQAAIAHRDRGVVAVDLAGVEEVAPGPLFVQHYRKARDAGLHITVHAGEWSGVGSVRQAVLELGAERLGHAVAAAHDPATMDLIAERGIGIESCPTSNCLLYTSPSPRDRTRTRMPSSA